MRPLEAKSLHALDWPDILSALATKARSLQGQAMAATLPLHESLEATQACLGAVAELGELEALGEAMPTGGILNISTPLQAAQKGGVLALVELSECADCLVEMHRLEHWLKERADRAPILKEMAQALNVEPDLQKLLSDSFEAPGILSERCYPELHRHRQDILKLASSIQRTLDRLLKEPHIQALLQDNFVTSRGGRAVLPIRASAKRSGLGIVHDTSSSGETVFIEPTEIVELHNQKREAEGGLLREEARIRGLLSAALGEHSQDLQCGLRAVWELDLVAARLGLGEALNGEIPQVGEEGIIQLDMARHPLLVLSGGTVVANGLGLDAEGPGLVLTGPNAGGKTVALKTVAMAALFVRAGIPFPAKQGLRIDFFKHIIADIGDAQGLAEGLSTFSAHMLTLKEALDMAGENTLVLLDELAVGTDPTQGAALAQVVLQDLVEAGARVVTTTHYTELKGLPALDCRFRSAAVAFADGKPTYQLRMGEVGLSHAFAIAAQMGLSDALITRAKAALGEHQRSWVEQSEMLAEEIAAQREAQEALKRALGEAVAAKDKHERELNKLKKQRDILLDEERKACHERQRAAEEQIKVLIAELQANPTLKSAGRALKELRDRAPNTAVQRNKGPVLNFAKGEHVRILSLDKVGIVNSSMRGGKLEVQVGPIGTWVSPEDLAPATPVEQRPKTSFRAPQGVSKTSRLRTSSNTLDLRGMRAEEAIQAVDFFLDRLIQSGDSVAYLLHGHGTGALKKAVRAYLPTHPVVEQWRGATDSEGGDAFTIVDLR
jgi:DNA mismatch repair protein MutS2